MRTGRRAPRRRLLPAALALLLLPWGGRAAAGGAPPPGPERVVVLGIDGADAAVFEDLLARGRLPHCAAIRDRGTYARLATTNPAQSPVSWAAFATASNPGKTGIYDFLRRDPDVPGRIEISLASRTWTAAGLPGRTLRLLLPLLAGLAAGLLAFGILRLLLRLAPSVGDRQRRLAGSVAGVAVALLLGGAAHRTMRWIPEQVPKAVNQRLGVPLWSVLGEAGVPVMAVEAPVSFPADRARNLRLLSGLGTPDVQGTWGLYAVFTDDPKEVVTPETGGMVDHLAFGPDGRARSRVYGPQDITLDPAEKEAIDRAARFSRGVWELKTALPSAKRFEERVAQHADRARQASCILEVTRDAAAGTATVRVGVGGPKPVLDLPLPEDPRGPASPQPADGDGSVRWLEPVTLREREWSPYVPFEFAMNPLVRVKGLGKFWLESAGGGGREFRLVLSPVAFDPREVPEIVEIAFPREFAPSLAAQAGLYNTTGWPCLTNPVKDGLLSDAAFLAHAREVLAERRAKLRAALADPGWRFLFMMFAEVDRVQHAFWRHVDPASPLHDAAAAAEFGGAIEEFYVAMDGVIGEILAAGGEGTAVIVMSDHGFAPFRRAVNLNTFLLEKGFQVNRGSAGGTGPDQNVTELFTGQSFFQRIDWGPTKAYAIGLGEIYLNLAGREKQGSVPEADYDAVCAGIREALLALRDGDGSRVVREVYRGREIYAGPTAARFAPDLVVGFERGYRVSWQTTLGGGGPKVIEDNRFRWSGDHCSVDPSLVPGILLSTVPLEAGKAGVMDVAPTVLDLLGVPAPEAWDGRSLLRR